MTVGYSAASSSTSVIVCTIAIVRPRSGSSPSSCARQTRAAAWRSSAGRQVDDAEGWEREDSRVREAVPLALLRLEDGPDVDAAAGVHRRVGVHDDLPP